MALIIYVNCDTQDEPLNTTGVDWVEFAEGIDQIIFSGGSDVVADGEPIPSQNELIQAGVILTGSEIILDDYFLSDISDNEIKQIFNMGNQDKRYVLAFDFDAATASEPTFEAYDDDSLETISSTILGSGTPSLSFIRGITTTDGSPGTNWVGSKLAGLGSGNFLYLNNQNGALTGAATLYAQLKIVIPATQTIGFSANPVFVVKWLSN